MKKIFIGVNYNTSALIENWYNSVQSSCKNNKFYVVDNFHSESERSRVISICERLGVHIVESENVGYGRALNKCLAVVKSEHEYCAIVAGNLDVMCLNFPEDLPDGNYVYICEAVEGSKDRNPFLTKFQSRFLSLFTLPLVLNNVYIFMAVILLIKILGKFPSKLWAVHGSVFCFNSRILSDIEIFNEKTFLYTEELEFASYVQHISKSEYKMTNIRFQHTAHAATSSIIKKRVDFFALWRLGFSNWRNRWGHKGLKSKNL